MATIPKKKYLINTTGGQQMLVLPSYYDQIKNQIGLTSAPANSTATEASTKELMRTGQALKLRTRRKTVTGKYVTTDIICDVDKAPSACAQLQGKNFGNNSAAGAGNIISAYFPRRRRLG